MFFLLDPAFYFHAIATGTTARAHVCTCNRFLYFWNDWADYVKLWCVLGVRVAMHTTQNMGWVHFWGFFFGMSTFWGEIWDFKCLTQPFCTCACPQSLFIYWEWLITLLWKVFDTALIPFFPAHSLMTVKDVLLVRICLTSLFIRTFFVTWFPNCPIYDPSFIRAFHITQFVSLINDICNAICSFVNSLLI